MGEANYQSIGARLSQGEVVRTPVGLFASLLDLKPPSNLDEDGPALTTEDMKGAAVSVPRLVVRGSPVVLRSWYLPAVVVSPNCYLDKKRDRVLVAPILPLSFYEQGSRDALRAGQFVSALCLPPEPDTILADNTRAPFPASVVELRHITTVTGSLIEKERMFALGPDQLDRFLEAWVRFVALQELSSTGTIAAAEGKRIEAVSVVESSRKRHTILLELEDGPVLVLYQEPRRAGAQIQAIRLEKGAFVPDSVQGLMGSNLALRFENDESRAWYVSCAEVGMKSREIKSAGTTDVLLRLPDTPGEISLVNDQKRGNVLRIAILQGSRSRSRKEP